MPTQLHLGDESQIKMPNPFGKLNREALRHTQALAHTSTPVTGEQYRQIKLNAISGESPLQTRAPFDPEHDGEDQALLDSLASDRQRVPVFVVETGDSTITYTILDGHRRVAALRHLGQETVKAVIVKGETLECDLITLTANVRKHLTPLEQARSVTRLRERHELTLEQIAHKVGLSRRYLSELMALLDTDPTIQTALERGSIKAKTALALGQAPHELQPEVATIAAANHLSETEAKRYLTRLRETGETPSQAALALGFISPEKESAAQESETTKPDIEEDSVSALRRKSSHTQKRNKSKSTLTFEMAMALIKSAFPELDERTAKALAEQAAKQSATPPMLKTAGLLVLSGSTVDKAFETAWPIAHQRSIQKLVHIADVFVDLQGLAGRGQALPEWTSLLVVLTKQAIQLKQIAAKAKRPKPSRSRSHGTPQRT